MAPYAPAETTLISRVPVLGVVLSAALALGAAAVMSDYPMGGPPAIAMLVAVGGAVAWWYSPRVGYWMLLVDGLITTAVSGIALSRGAVPWLLVAFWGGCALLLAAILHLTAGAGRSSTVTLVAVISLLALSALGLGQYVRTTWTLDERAILERLPQLVSQSPAPTLWTTEIAPAPDGAWCCAWLMPASHAEAMRDVRSALVGAGWRIQNVTSSRLSAEKAGEHLDIILTSGPGESPSGTGVARAAATEIGATVRHVALAAGP